MRLRALLVLGLLQGCFLLEDEIDVPREVSNEPPDCECPPDACGPLVLEARCAIRACVCERGLSCLTSEVAGEPGSCVAPCEDFACPDGACGTIENPRAECTTFKRDCGNCTLPLVCEIPGGKEGGTCVEFSCPDGLVPVEGNRCVAAPEDCWSAPTLLGGQAEDGERSADGELTNWPASIAVTVEGDGAWLWFLTNRWTAGNGVRLARIALTADGDSVRPETLESFAGLTPVDVGWTYEFAIALDGSELFLGLAAPGADGWMDARLEQFVRDGATFLSVGEVVAAGRFGDWSHRPVLLPDGRSLIANRPPDKVPTLYQRDTTTPGDGSFSARGAIDLGPGFTFVAGENSGVVGPRASIPGPDGRRIVGQRVDYLDHGVRGVPADWVVFTVPVEPTTTEPESTYVAPPAAFGARVMPDLLPDLGGAASVAAPAFSQDGERMYQFRHGFFSVSHREPCP